MNPSNVTSINSLHSIRVSLVIVDSLLLFSIVIGFVFCISFICISIGFRSCRSVLTLLSANSCVAGLIFNSVQLSNTLLLLRDDIHLTSSLDNQYCAIRSYSMHVSGSLLYYSFCVQAISRLFFVVFYKYTFLLTYHIHFILIAIQWTLSLLLPFSLLTSEDVQYQVETSQCFIKMKNVSQTLYGIISMFLLPMTIISICYTHIVCFVRAATRRARRTNAMPVRKFDLIRDQGALQIKYRFSSSKDIKVFRHIIFLIIILFIGGFPYSMLMVLNTNSDASFSVYRFCITIFSVSVTLDMAAIFFFNKSVRKVFFDICRIKPNQIRVLQRV